METYKIAITLGILADHPENRNTSVGKFLWQAKEYVEDMERQLSEIGQFTARKLEYYNATPDEWDHAASIVGWPCLVTQKTDDSADKQT